ncbi:MAG: galactokinase [Candidatus Goldbacteria bacterium]|nr:galactokinase [Candidatus Goldiibacteriota bacterium]
MNEFIQMHGVTNEDIKIFKAPARINIIGEHIDYNGGYVLPVAINLGCYVGLRKRKDNKIVIKSLNISETAICKLNKMNKFNRKITWVNYPAGVLNEFYKKGYKLKDGLDALFLSDIPIGSGLSSSAAFTVSFAYALSCFCGFNLDKKEIAIMCRRAENDFVGVSCGIMDQFATALSKKGHAIFLNCSNLDYSYIPFQSKEYSIVIIDSNKKRKLTESKYNERTKECDKALKFLNKKIKAENLCGITPDIFEKNKKMIKDEIILKRARHVIYEQERVKSAATALKNNNFIKLGKLLIQSHISLRDDYEVTGFELDTLFDVAINQQGCIGSRMTGAGFGGCTINIVKKDYVYDFKKNVLEQYRKKTGLYPDFYVVEAGDGVMEI